MKTKRLISLIATLLVLACSAPFNIMLESSSPTSAPLAASAISNAAAEPSSTETLAGAPSATSTMVAEPSSTNMVPVAPSASLTPNPINTSSSTSGTISAVNPTAADYIDDRSTPSQVIVSYFNAINRKEYARAYGYWRDPSNSVGNFSSFADGYGNTASVTLVFGTITGDPAMSQIHYSVPVILKATLTSGLHANWVACYDVHEVQPDVFGAPPFEPMEIDRASVNPSDLNADDATVLANACSGSAYAGSFSVPVGGNPMTIDKNNFLDNRSGPIETVSSLLNSLNLKQYVRAYYYFKNPSNFPGPYDSYTAGFADTGVITATFGAVQSEGAAGTLYYKVPLGMKVLTTSSTTQTFVGCITLSLAQPGAQAVPPFQPMGIVTARFIQVDNSTDLNSQLPTACN